MKKFNCHALGLFCAVMLTGLVVSGCEDEDAQNTGSDASQITGSGDASIADSATIIAQDAQDSVDVGAADVHTDASVDGAGADAATPKPGGALLVTKSPPGNAPQAAWDGVLLYDIGTTGGTATQKADIDKSLVRDPAGLAYRPASSEVLIGNRHGNTAADGVAGSISRFLYNPVLRTFTPQGTITGNGLIAVHQLFVSPQGELFAANRDNGVSRFVFNSENVVTPNGTIGNGATRGVATSPDGKRLYVTAASNVIRQYDLSTGNELTALTLNSVANLHYMATRQGQLYVAALDDNKVYRYDIGANNDLTAAGAIDSAAPVAVAFSEDEQEMFVSGHRTGHVVLRFRHDANSQTWIPSGQIDVGVSLGAVVMLPTRDR